MYLLIVSCNYVWRIEGVLYVVIYMCSEFLKLVRYVFIILKFLINICKGIC